MNVEEFVKTTLTEIARAAILVENEKQDQFVKPEITVHFDIAVTTTDKSGVEGGGQLVVASLLKVGAGAKDVNEVQNYSRVSFDLEFHIPSSNY